MPTAAEELLLKISGDATGGEQAIKAITDKVDGLGGGAKGAGDKLGSLNKVLDELTPKTNTAGGAFTSMKSILHDTFEDPTAAAKRLSSAMVEDLLPSLGSVGVATGLVAGALVVVGVGAFKLTEQAAEAGGFLNDMSEKTGESVVALSRQSNALKVAGSDMGTWTNALFMLQKGLGEDSEKVAKGLDKIGLSTNELKAAGPDRYMELIATHMKATEDPGARAAAVMEIFGKSGKELIPTLLKIDEAMAATADIQPWTDEQAREAEAFEMQMASLKVHVAALAEALGRDLIPTVAWLVENGSAAAKWGASMMADLSGLSEMVHIIRTEWDYLRATLEAFGIEATKIPKVTGDAKKGVEDWHQSVAAMQIAVPSLDQAMATSTTATREMKEAHTLLAAELKKAAEEATKWAELEANMAAATGTLRERVDALDGSVLEGIKYYLARGVAVDQLSKYYDVSKESIHAITEELKLEQLARQLAERQTKTYQDEASATTEALYQQDELLRQGLNPNLTIASYAFESAGFKVDNFGTSVDLANAKGKEFLKTIRDASTMSKTFGAVMGDIPSLVQHAFTGGGGVGGALNAIGSDVGSRVGGDIAGSLTKTLTEGGTKALSGMANGLLKAIPVVGSLIGPAMEFLFSKFGPSAAELEGRKVEAAFEQSFGGFQQMMTAVGAVYEATGRGAAAAQRDVKALLDAEKQGGQAATDAAAKIKLAFSEQTEDANVLNAAIQKYGFSIDQLGPTMQRQQLNDQAKALIVDWTALAGSGMNVVTVDQKMASSVWDYLQLAKQTGQEVPAAMKPVIDSMLEQGVFTDANGDKITEMKDLGITFSETMTQGFDKVVKKLQELLEKMGKVPAALAAASGPIDVDVNLNGRWNMPDAPDWGGQMAAGGDFVVSRPTLFLAGEAGPERATFSGANQVGVDRGIVVNVTVEGNVATERELAEAIGQHLANEFTLRGGALPLGVSR